MNDSKMFLRVLNSCIMVSAAFVASWISSFTGIFFNLYCSFAALTLLWNISLAPSRRGNNFSSDVTVEDRSGQETLFLMQNQSIYLFTFQSGVTLADARMYFPFGFADIATTEPRHHIAYKVELHRPAQ